MALGPSHILSIVLAGALAAFALCIASAGLMFIRWKEKTRVSTRFLPLNTNGLEPFFTACFMNPFYTLPAPHPGRPGDQYKVACLSEALESRSLSKIDTNVHNILRGEWRSSPLHPEGHLWVQPVLHTQLNKRRVLILRDLSTQCYVAQMLPDDTHWNASVLHVALDTPADITHLAEVVGQSGVFCALQLTDLMLLSLDWPQRKFTEIARIGGGYSERPVVVCRGEGKYSVLRSCRTGIEELRFKTQDKQLILEKVGNRWQSPLPWKGVSAVKPSGAVVYPDGSIVLALEAEIPIKDALREKRTRTFLIRVTMEQLIRPVSFLPLPVLEDLCTDLSEVQCLSLDPSTQRLQAWCTVAGMLAGCNTYKINTKNFFPWTESI